MDERQQVIQILMDADITILEPIIRENYLTWPREQCIRHKKLYKKQEQGIDNGTFIFFFLPVDT